MPNITIVKGKNTLSEVQRHNKTIRSMLNTISTDKKILDLGTKNTLSEKLIDSGYNVLNTSFDLDKNPYRLININTDVVTAFEILEHLIEPAQVLKNIQAKEIVVSVPLLRRFEKVYWNEKDEYDQHFHEFTTKQFDKLLRYCGYKILNNETWKSYSSVLGTQTRIRHELALHDINDEKLELNILGHIASWYM